MRKLIYFIIFFNLIFISSAMAMKTPVMSYSNGDLNNAAEGFLEVNSSINRDPSDFDINAWQLCPVNATLNEFNVKLRAAPGAGNSYAFTFRVEGVDTAAVVTISGTDTSGTWSGSISITAGDRVSIKYVPTSTPDVTRAAWSCVFEAGTNEAPLFLSLGTSGFNDSGVNTTYTGYYGANITSTTEISRQQVISTPGTFSKFYISLTAAPGVGKSYAITFRKNGADQAITLTISDTNTDGSDLTNSFSVVAGDVISIKEVPSGTPAGAGHVSMGVLFTPTTDGESPIGFGSSDDPSNTAASYSAISSSATTGAWTATEADRQALGIGCVIKDLYVKVQTDPTTALSSWTFALRQSGSTSALSVNIASGATTGNDTANDITITSSNLLNIICTPTLLPVTGNVWYGMTAYIEPTSTTNKSNFFMVFD